MPPKKRRTPPPGRDPSTPPGTAGESPDWPEFNDAFRQELRNEVYLDRRSPRGFLFDDNVCYRNAVLIMLMSSNTLMSFINKYLHPELMKHKRRLNEKSKSKSGYNDLLLEIAGLAKNGFHAPKKDTREEEMEISWTYIRSVDVGWQGRWRKTGQQDAGEFLGFILESSRIQLNLTADFIERSERKRCNEVIRSGLDEVIRVGWAKKKMCTGTGCVKSNPVKHRIGQGDIGDVLQVSLPKEGEPSFGTRPTLADLLDRLVRQPANGYLCDDCQSVWEDEYNAITNKKWKDSMEKEKTEKPGREWSYLRVLPEVLLVQLGRFKRVGKSILKNAVEVELEEEIDLAPFLDKSMPEAERKPSKYTLRSVISHFGSLKAGHYCNYVRYGDEEKSTWARVDGEDVDTVTFDSVNKDERGAGKGKNRTIWTPYILCYERNASEPSSPESGVAQSTTLPAKRPSPPKKLSPPRTTNALAPTTQPAKVATKPTGKGKSQIKTATAAPTEVRPPRLNFKITIGPQMYQLPPCIIDLPEDFVKRFSQGELKFDLGAQLEMGNSESFVPPMLDFVERSYSLEELTKDSKDQMDKMKKLKQEQMEIKWDRYKKRLQEEGKKTNPLSGKDVRGMTSSVSPTSRLPEGIEGKGKGRKPTKRGPRTSSLPPKLNPEVLGPREIRAQARQARQEKFAAQIEADRIARLGGASKTDSDPAKNPAKPPAVNPLQKPVDKPGKTGSVTEELPENNSKSGAVNVKEPGVPKVPEVKKPGPKSGSDGVTKTTKGNGPTKRKPSDTEDAREQPPVKKPKPNPQVVSKQQPPKKRPLSPEDKGEDGPVKKKNKPSPKPHYPRSPSPVSKKPGTRTLRSHDQAPAKPKPDTNTRVPKANSNTQAPAADKPGSNRGGSSSSADGPEYNFAEVEKELKEKKKAENATKTTKKRKTPEASTEPEEAPVKGVATRKSGKGPGKTKANTKAATGAVKKGEAVKKPTKKGKKDDDEDGAEDSNGEDDEEEQEEEEERPRRPTKKEMGKYIKY
jgi:ubiquitin C-terminal hydrolase